MSATESEKDQKEYRYSWWEEVSSLPGMCEREKAAWLFDLVLRLRPRHCLEVGVYGGRSLCAIAYGLQTNAFGRVTGIDTWASESTAEDTRYDTVNDPNWRQETLDACYFDLIHFFVAKGLVPFTRIVTGDSWLARTIFAKSSVQLIHIDGCHTRERAIKDVLGYTSALVPGGYLVMDDIDWESVKPAYEVARKICTVVEEFPTWSVLQKR